MHLLAKIRLISVASVILIFGISLTQAQEKILPSQMSFSEPHLHLGHVAFGVHPVSVWLTNNSEHVLQISELVFLQDEISVLDYPESIVSHDSTLIEFELELNRDLDYNAIIAVSGANLAGLAALQISALPRLENDLYLDAANLWGEDLKNELYSLITNHTVFGYTQAREQMFGDYDNESGQVQCVYTGEWLATSGIPDHTVMNTEHTWPQSMGAEGTARTDMHHLYPTMSWVNSTRGNLPFGVVVNETGSDGGSSWGSDGNGTSVFEPRDTHKGDCARSMLYFSLRYDNPYSFISYQEETLRDWALADLVSQKEEDRNDAIDNLQHNRNPFVDNMNFLERIASLSGNADLPATRELHLLMESVDFGPIAVGDTASVEIYLYNPGRNQLLMGYFDLDDDISYSVSNTPSAVNSRSWETATIHFHPQEELDFPAELTMSSNGQNGTLQLVSLSGEGDGFSSIAEFDVSHAASWTIDSIYPNPFNPVTSVKLEVQNYQEIEMSVWNVNGSLVRRWLQNLQPGANVLSVDLSSQASGIFFLQAAGSNHFETQRLLLLK
jgi:deoxyribonuclease I